MRKNLLLTALVAVLAGGVLHAQDLTTAALAGRVTNQNGQPLQGVRLQLASPSMLQVRQTITDANGQFRVSLLPNGEYTVTYILSGYMTRKLTLRIVAGQVANASTSLTEIVTQSETVDITGASTIIAQKDKTDTIVQTSYSADFLELLSGRSFGNLGRLAPGINTTNPISQSGVNVHIRGGTGASTRVMVNGGTVDNMISNETMQGILPVGDLIESIAIIQSPLNARYGNSDGGLLSAVTARGTNTFSGTARWNISRPSGWGQRDDFYYPYPRDPSYRPALPTVNPGVDNYTKSMEFSLTGPIWKDHITFSYGTRLTPTTYSVANTAWSTYLGTKGDPQPYNRMGTYYQDPTGDVIRRAELFSASEYDATRTNIVEQTFNQFTVYWQVLPQHQLEYGYNENKVYRQNEGRTVEMGPWDTTGTTYRTWNMGYRGIVGSSGILEARYSSAFFWWDYGVRGGATPPPVRSWTMGSYRPIDGNFANGSTSNYWASGYLGALLSRTNMSQWDLTGTGALPPQANTGLSSLVSNGLPAGAPG
ncbi:MAG: carboxypeptidase regulatory-like domain-containing protein, partial [Holophagales bacterium]|nr:carboxypeptidase regulatory-like domain-containing protein [Holophagales bacterium]